MLIDRKIFSAISFVIAIVITSLSWAYELKEVIISGDNSSGPYRISSKPVVVSSDSIWIDGDLQSQPENYFFDYSRGFISFNMPVSDSSSIRAQFIPIYFKFTNPYFIYKPESINLKSAFQPDSTKIPSYSDRQTAKYEPGMNIGGSKSFSFEIGSAQDPDISQALDLTIRGPVVKGVNATAFVSDKGTPALAEGTSSTIDEIDKFFINISAKNFSATLGDYYTDFNDLKLARYSKKLKGVSLNYDDNVNYAYLSGASSSGRLTINRFVGNEGNQGPYFLTDPSGSRGFIILPGTETVYIDGEVLVRGSDNDYIIDYQNAHVTFTPKMLITSDSRIEVEFEYSSREFSRSFYTSRVQRNSKNGIYSFGATVIAEADDKSRPLNTTLSDDDKQTIKNAGSNDYALKSGVEFVGSGKGEYNRLTDSTGYQYYQYIAPDSGEYRVSFSNLGSGNGEYIYIGRGVYEFVGVSNGDYSPVIKLPIPKSQYLYGFDGRISPSENITFQVETAYSRENKNRFLRSEAMYDDPALTINSELKSKFSKGYLPDIVEIKAYYRHSAKYFKPFAEFRGSDYYNRWNLPIDYVESDEDVGEGQISIDYNAKYKFNFGGGRLSRVSQGESNRWNASSSLDFPFDLRLITTISEAKYETENDSLTAGLGDKNWLRESSSQIEYSLWIFKPSIGYRYRYDASYNDNILKRGEKYNIYIGGLTITPTKRIVNSISYSIQFDDEFLDIWLRKDEARTIKEEISINDLPKGLDLNYQYTFREKKYKDITGTDSRQNLSYLKSSYDLGAFNLEYNHKYNRTRSALKLERFIKVEEGRGEYRFEDGEYIPDPFGEYIRIVEEAGDFRPVSEIDNTAIFRFDGRRLKNQEGTLKHIRVESNVEFNQRSEEIQIGFVDLINPWRDIDQSLIVNQRMNYIQDLYILSGNYKRKQEIRFRYNQDRNISAGGSYSGDYDDKRIGSFRLRKYLGSDFSLEAEYEREHRVVGGAARLKLDSDVVQPDISYTPSTAIEIGSGIKYRRDNETLDNYTVNLYSLLPHLRWNFSRKGRFDVNSEIIYVQSNDVEYFNFRIAEGNRKGNNYRLTVRGLLKLGEHSSGEVTYNLRKRPEEKTKHYARVQMKYSF